MAAPATGRMAPGTGADGAALLLAAGVPDADAGAETLGVEPLISSTFPATESTLLPNHQPIATTRASASTGSPAPDNRRAGGGGCGGARGPLGRAGGEGLAGGQRAPLGELRAGGGRGRAGHGRQPLP